MFGKSFANFNQRKLKRKRRASISPPSTKNVRVMKVKASSLRFIPCTILCHSINTFWALWPYLFRQLLFAQSIAGFIFILSPEWRMKTKPVRTYSPAWISTEDNELFVYFQCPNCRERSEKFNLKYKQPRLATVSTQGWAKKKCGNKKLNCLHFMGQSLCVAGDNMETKITKKMKLF